MSEDQGFERRQPPPPPPPPPPEPTPDPAPQANAMAGGLRLFIVALISLFAFQFLLLMISAGICAYDGLVLNPTKEACPALPEQQKDAFNRAQETILALLAGRGLQRP